MATGYFLKLDHFEGPLDLLLYLIKLNEMDIFEVDLVDLSEQYLSYLRLVQFTDLKDASAFLLMGASLCEIKTRRLLPNSEKNLADGEEDDLNLEEQLKERLLEFQKFKNAGEYLNNIYGDTKLTYGSMAEWERFDKMFGESISPLFGDPAVLVILYEQLLSSLVDKKPVRVKTNRELLTVERVVQKMLDYLQGIQTFLFQDFYSRINTRYELIAHILALLELLKQVKDLRCHQESLFGPMWLYWCDETNPELVLPKIKEQQIDI